MGKKQTHMQNKKRRRTVVAIHTQRNVYTQKEEHANIAMTHRLLHEISNDLRCVSITEKLLETFLNLFFLIYHLFCWFAIIIT